MVNGRSAVALFFVINWSARSEMTGARLAGVDGAPESAATCGAVSAQP